MKVFLRLTAVVLSLFCAVGGNGAPLEAARSGEDGHPRPPCQELLRGAPATAVVPIIMYHNISKNGRLLGKFTVSPDEFEDDLRFLESAGFTCVTMADLHEFVANGAELPKKPVVLTFDDGHYGVYRYGCGLLEKYRQRAVMSIIGAQTDKYSAEKRRDINFPHLTWDMVNEMADRGLFEFQNHSYDLHKGAGAGKRRGESAEAYRQRVSADLSRMQERMIEMTGAAAQTFTYPFGNVSKYSLSVLKDLGFLSSLSCFNGVNTVTAGEPDCLFTMCRIIRPHGRSLGRILCKFPELNL